MAMSEDPVYRTGAMSEQMAWDVVFEIALRALEAHGANIPDAARHIGPYSFFREVQGTGLTLTREGSPA